MHNNQRTAEEKKKVIDDVVAEVKQGRLRTYVERHRFDSKRARCWTPHRGQTLTPHFSKQQIRRPQVRSEGQRRATKVKKGVVGV